MKSLRDTVCCLLLVVSFAVEAENSDQQSLSKGLALIEQQKFSEAEEYLLSFPGISSTGQLSEQSCCGTNGARKNSAGTGKSEHHNGGR